MHTDCAYVHTCVHTRHTYIQIIQNIHRDHTFTHSIHTITYISIYTYIHIRTHIQLCCTYIRMYTYTYTYIRIYTYTQTHTIIPHVHKTYIHALIISMQSYSCAHRCCAHSSANPNT